MSEKTPIEKSKYINDELRIYLKSTFELEDKTLNNDFVKELENANLMNGPFLAINYPFETGKSVNELIDEGVISKQFREFCNIELDRKLYKHQELAIRKSLKKRNLVISTGTGSGKTESFLFPILNRITKKIENGEDISGINALMLYPMNALANDQKDRIRDILRKYPKINFGYYTGETEEKASKGKALYEKDNKKPLINEYVSREQITENPPQILFTNYSMLEYIMIRPDDFTLFEDKFTRNWDFIVLDEAHVYRGALGIEVSMLLKRLQAYLNHTPQFFITSATLGSEKDFPDIINFANALTSVKFENADIILGSRKVLSINGDYSVSPKDYIEVKKRKEDGNEFGDIFDKYNIDGYKNGEQDENVHKLLLQDENLGRFLKCLSIPKVSNEVIKELKKNDNTWDNDSIAAFTDLIVTANKYEFIVDVKYHAFVRTLSGAYITLRPEKKLSLKPADNINGSKAYEIAVCKYCKTVYLFGVIKNNYLYQVDDSEMYVIDEKDAVKRHEHFLIKELVNNWVEIDKDKYEEYELCSKCGHIRKISNLNDNDCSCTANYKSVVLRVNDKEEKIKESKAANNLNKCICCNAFSKSGCLQAFYSGKDASTVLIAQMLYKMLGDEKLPKEDVKKIAKNPFAPKEKITSDMNDKKQLIVFSDSRQQTSYFASFYYYEYKQFLRKKILLKAIENNNEKPISIHKFHAIVANIISENNLLKDDDNRSNREYAVNEAWLTMLYELFEVDGKNSLRGLGLLYFRPTFLSNIDDFKKDVKELFKDANIEDVKTLIEYIIGYYNITPAVDYSFLQLSREQRDLLKYRSSDISKVLLKNDEKDKKSTHTFLIGKNENKILNYVKRAFKIDDDVAIKYIENAFNFIGQNNLDGVEENQNSLNNYEVVSGNNLNWFICPVCNKMTNLNIKNCCISKNCKGKLEKCDPNEKYRDNYYRNIYLNKELEIVEIKEHSAQLDKKKAAEYQRKFKEKEINILSCSTTFEMGVDIGSLNNVFLRNVPPTPANYVQRAGRAGRRKGSSAFILTFCSSRSHDFSYFNDPISMLKGEIVPPYFNVKNEKIILRHLFAACLGFFFRKKFYKKIEDMVDDDGRAKFNEYIKSEPKDMISYINNGVLKDFDIEEKNKLDWQNKVIGKDSNLNIYFDDIENEIRELKELILLHGNDVSTKTDVFKNMIKNIIELDTISTFSKNGVIPKYGFPVDVVELKTRRSKETGKNQGQEMTRDLSIAISEYAPGSEIIVDKKKYVSRYINKLKDKEFIYRYYTICDTCRRMTIGNDKDSDEFKNCKYCNGEINNSKKFIIPSYGFITEEKSTNAGNSKPKKTYATEVYYLDNTIADDTVFKDNNVCFNGNIEIANPTNGQLAKMNSNQFFTCEKCGYSELDRENVSSSKTLKHKNSTGYGCSESRLNKLALGHIFSTDVIIMSFPHINMKYEVALSVLYAFLEGISQAFQIERRDISGLVLNTGVDNYKLIIFDDVPGGAGHVKRLMEEELLKLSLKLALKKVSNNCCDEDKSCKNCLRNYGNEKFHPLLTRKSALKVLRELENEIDQCSKENSIFLDFGKTFNSEYENWDDAAVTLEYENMSAWDEFEIPFPDYTSLHLNVEGNKFDALFLWKNKKLLIVEQLISDKELNLIRENGYDVIFMESVSVEIIKKKLGIV
ncbi:MAG: DEAD/DEAH box helicase [Bacilli bacterium]